MKTAKEWSTDYYSADNMEMLIEVIQKDAQQELLEACQLALANLAPIYSSDHLVIKKLTSAIANATQSTTGAHT